MAGCAHRARTVAVTEALIAHCVMYGLYDLNSSE